MSVPTPPPTRRQFLTTAAAGAAALAARPARSAPGQLTRRPPNLLFMHVDQLHADILSGVGCTHVRTPNFDRAAARGLSFPQTYVANSVCCPSRSCWYTGRASCETGVVVNEMPIDENLPDLGQWFSARGYEAVYAGKWHIPGRPLAQSFRVLTFGMGVGEHGDGCVSRAGEAFLHTYRGDKPFFLNLGFLQPHDCCYWVFEHARLLDQLPYPEVLSELPALPPNHDVPAAEPEFFQQTWRGARQAHLQWSDLQWRYYLWAYDRMVEMVDAEVGRVLDALEDSGHADDTLLILTSDHGDGLGRHKMVSKMFLYDEASRVPLTISWPGHVPEGQVDRRLVSSLDLPATLCDYAGIDAPPKQRGRSLRPVLEQREVQWREFLVSEAHKLGRMVRTDDWKLVQYEGSATKQLFNLREDPGESHNRFASAADADTLHGLEQRLADWTAQLEPLSLEGRRPVTAPKPKPKPPN